MEKTGEFKVFFYLFNVIPYLYKVQTKVCSFCQNFFIVKRERDGLQGLKLIAL